MSTKIGGNIKNVSESSDFTEITPEVGTDSKVLYLIRINKEEMGFVDSEVEAKLVIDSLAAKMVDDLESKTAEIYRKDSAKCEKIVISKKDLGILYNSSVYPVLEIDFLPVGHAVLTKGRHELPTAVSNSSYLPPEECLSAKLNRISAGVKGTPVSSPEKDEEEDEEEQKTSDSGSELIS